MLTEKDLIPFDPVKFDAQILHKHEDMVLWKLGSAFNNLTVLSSENMDFRKDRTAILLNSEDILYLDYSRSIAFGCVLDVYCYRPKFKQHVYVTAKAMDTDFYLKDDIEEVQSEFVNFLHQISLVVGCKYQIGIPNGKRTLTEKDLIPFKQIRLDAELLLKCYVKYKCSFQLWKLGTKFNGNYVLRFIYEKRRFVLILKPSDYIYFSSLEDFTGGTQVQAEYISTNNESKVPLLYFSDSNEFSFLNSIKIFLQKCAQISGCIFTTTMPENNIEKILPNEQLFEEINFNNGEFHSLLKEYADGEYALQSYLESLFTSFDSQQYRSVLVGQLTFDNNVISVWKLPEQFFNLVLLSISLKRSLVVHFTDIFTYEIIRYPKHMNKVIVILKRYFKTESCDGISYEDSDVLARIEFSADQGEKIVALVEEIKRIGLLIAKESGCKFQEGKPNDV